LSTGSSPARSAVWPNCGSTRWVCPAAHDAGHCRGRHAAGHGRRAALGELDWRRTETLANGLLVTFETALAGDLHTARQDADGTLNDTEARLTPYGAIELRYPLQRPTRTACNTCSSLPSRSPGPRPLAMRSRWKTAPSSNSTRPASSRSTASPDRTGARRASARRWASATRASTRWAGRPGITAGIVLRADDLGQFTPGSGLDGATSDWLLATHFTLGDSVRVINRALFDQQLDFTSNELVLNWRGDMAEVASTYTWLEADPAEGRDDDLAEWAFDAGYRFDSDWTAGVNWRYDFAEAEPTRAGLRLGYENECVDVEFSVSRRYTTTDA
jgi:LPS-assembly protein